MAFTEPAIHRVTKITARAKCVDCSNDPFAYIAFEFTTAKGETAECTAYADARLTGYLAKLADAINAVNEPAEADEAA